MSFAIFTENEGTLIEGNVSIQPSDESLGQNASLEVLGAIFTNNFSEYNTGYGIHIFNTQNVTGDTSASIVFYGGSRFQKEISAKSFIDIEGITVPSSPDPKFTRMFFNTIGNVIQTIDTNNKISTLNPLVSKGDIVVHDGTTETRLPVGADGEILVADSSESSGIKWTSGAGSGGNESSKGGAITLDGIQKTMVKDVLYGTFLNTIVNEVSKGPCANFFISKSRDTISSGRVQTSFSPGITTLERLRLRWFTNEEVEMFKNGTEYDGDYASDFYDQTTGLENVTLSGTSWIEIFPETTGVFVVKVTNDIGGPVANFLICKNIASHSGGAIIRISQSPSASNTKLRLRWQSGSGIDLRKDGTDSDGSYTFTNILSLASNTTVNVTLTGTTPVELSRKYQRISTIVTVHSNISNAPYAIFSVSKGDKTISGNIVRLASSPGGTSLEKLRLTWSAEDTLQLYKDASGYNGVYIVTIVG